MRKCGGLRLSTAVATGYDRSVRSSPIIKIAAGVFVGMLLVAAVLVVRTELRVEDAGPIIVFGVAALSVFLLLFTPTGSAR